MSIRKPLKLAWNGKVNNLVITMLVIERVQNEIGIMNIVKFNHDNLDFVMISKLFYILLDEAGAGVTWDDVYENMFAVSAKEKKALFGLLAEIVPMLMPNFKGGVKKKKSVRKKKKRS